MGPVLQKKLEGVWGGFPPETPIAAEYPRVFTAQVLACVLKFRSALSRNFDPSLSFRCYRTPPFRTRRRRVSPRALAPSTAATSQPLPSSRTRLIVSPGTCRSLAERRAKEPRCACCRSCNRSVKWSPGRAPRERRLRRRNRDRSVGADPAGQRKDRRSDEIAAEGRSSELPICCKCGHVAILPTNQLNTVLDTVCPNLFGHVDRHVQP